MNFIRRPSPFVLCATNHGSMIVNHKDYHIVKPGVGYGVGYQLLNSGCFDPEEVGLVLHLLNQRRQYKGDGVVAIDGGANVGVHTLEWAKHMHSWGQVIAIEAQERIYYALAGNIGLNNCFNASAIHAALGAEVGTLRMPRPDYNSPASFGSLELRPNARNEYIGQAIHYEEEQCISVQLLPIDAFAPQRVDFIKIDVEGMELEVLAGAKKTIERNKPHMLIETIKTDKQAVIRLLESQDYKVLDVGINALAIHMQDPAINSIQINPAAS